MKPRQRRQRDERGSVTLWIALSTFVMMALVGLAVDLGGQVYAQQRAHDLAAQAARAGGQQVQPATAIQGQAVRVDTAAARTAAQDYLRAAGATGSVSIVRAETLTVVVTDTYDPQFLTFLGINQLRVSGSASARLVRTLGSTEQ